MLRGWPSAKHASVSRFHPLNLERILWLRKRRRRKRRRRRRPRKPRRSEFRPGWIAQFRPGPQLRVSFGEWRAAGPPSSFSALCCRRPCLVRNCARAQGPIRRSPSVERWSELSSHNEFLWLWVPAFAGTTRGEDSAQGPLHALRSAYRSASASFAPSAAKPAAKLRRSQVITFGRVMTRSRTAAANRP